MEIKIRTVQRLRLLVHSTTANGLGNSVCGDAKMCHLGWNIIWSYEKLLEEREGEKKGRKGRGRKGREEQRREEQRREGARRGGKEREGDRKGGEITNSLSSILPFASKHQPLDPPLVSVCCLSEDLYL